MNNVLKTEIDNIMKPEKKTTPKVLPINNNVIPITKQAIIKEVTNKKNDLKPILHEAILGHLLEKVVPVDYRATAFPESIKIEKEIEALRKSIAKSDDSEEKIIELKRLKSKLNNYKLNRKHYTIITVEEIIRLAIKHNWGLAKQNNFIYIFNGEYWDLLGEQDVKAFLGKAAEKMGVDKFEARFCEFKKLLLSQFMEEAYLPKPERKYNRVLINLQNGTLEITPKGVKLRPHSRVDFLTYQSPFKYDKKAKATLFKKYLNTVQPDIERQNVLAEYIAYIFTHHLKLEKALLLYGSGANGKSVFFEIITALLGRKNVTNYSLYNLTKEQGHYRAKIGDALLNYCSDINGKLESSIFKLLVSGEPVEARALYGQPYVLNDYAKLMFNCNELPKNVELTNAFFRRFLIIPFDVTIPENEQDKELSKKIIDSELSGVFNWILEGLQRLLKQKNFSKCKAADDQLNDYRLNSDNLHLFLEDRFFTKSIKETETLDSLYLDYKMFCLDDNYRPFSKKNFSKQLESKGFEIKRRNSGKVVFIEKTNID